MNRDALIKKLQSILDEYEKQRAWGTIEIEMRDGQPDFIRRMTTDKLNPQENNRGQQRNRY